MSSKFYGYIFLHTINVNGKNRLRALPGQLDREGNPIRSDFNIQADKTIRNSEELGSIFVATIDKPINAGTHYSLMSNLRPLSSYSRTRADEAKVLQAFIEYDKDHNIVSLATEQVETEVVDNKDLNTPEKTKEKTFLDIIHSDPKYALPSVKTDGFAVKEKIWDKILRYIHRCKPIMLTGPTGSGKTELIELVCKRLGKTLSVYNCGAWNDPESQILGKHVLNDKKESVFKVSAFIEAIQKPGVILLDELNRAPMTALNYILPCLDGTRRLVNDATFNPEDAIVPVHPECVFLATANIGTEFTGTNDLDPALESRLARVQIDYPELNDEVRILVKRCGICQPDARNIVLAAQDTRKAYRKGELSKAMTVRQTINAAEAVADGLSVIDALRDEFLDYYEGETTEGEKSIVNAIICKY